MSDLVGNPEDLFSHNNVLILILDSIDTGCPGDCHGHGDCLEGQCHCYPGYTGWDCLQSK